MCTATDRASAYHVPPLCQRGAGGDFVRGGLQGVALICRNAVALLAAFFLSGCGLLYTGTVEPYSAKFDATPVGTKRCVITSHQIREPVTGASIYVEWTTSFILSEARKAGIEKIYYMDKKTLSVLLGIYKRESLIVYGD